MYERFTDRARKVMQLANGEAQRFNHEYIGTEHILLGLIKEGSGVAANVLNNLDVDLRKIRLEVEKIVQAGPGGSDRIFGKLPHTPRAKKVIEYSIEEARKLNHNHVGTEHLLLGLLREEEGVAAQVLMNLGLELKDVRDGVLNLLGNTIRQQQKRVVVQGSSTPFLDLYGADLTERARLGKLDRCVGRQDELTCLCEILACRARPNALLVGEPGVGKATLAAGLAQFIAAAQAPDWLARRVVLLSLNSLWTRNRLSQVSDVARAAFDEVRCAKNTTLFLPDAVASLGSAIGGRAAGRVHAELLLALRSDGMPTVLTATPANYQRCLERHPSLEHLVQPVALKPLTVDQTIAVVHGVRDRYEVHHLVRIPDEAVATVVDAADRQLPGALPGKAILLLDRAAARARARAWPATAESRTAIQNLDAQIEELKRQKEEAVAEQVFDRAAELRTRCDAIESEKERLVQQLRDRVPVADAVVDSVTVVDVVRDLAAHLASR